MKRIPGLRRLFRLPTTPARVASEVSDEVAFHLEMQARDLEAQGLEPEAARAEAVRRFGDVGAARAELGAIDHARVRRSWRAEWWEALVRDVYYAARGLGRQPAFAAFVIVTLGLGIGANTAMFSIADALVLRELPVPHAERLTLLATGDVGQSNEWTNPIWEAIRDRPALHDGAFAFSTTGFDLAERGEVDPVEGLRASGGIFDALGVRAHIGRTFTVADDRRGFGPDGPVAVIGYGFWQRRYGGDPGVVGRTINLNRAPYTIIGVTPPSFFGPEVGRAFDVAIPLNAVDLANGDAGQLDGRSNWWLTVMLRLAPGQSAAEATARLRAVQHQIADETRPTDLRADQASHHLEEPFTLAPASIGSSELRQSYRKPVLTLLAIVSLTLLIACGNIANLMLARTAARRHELSVRTALGASGGRLVRQLFAESALLSVAGAALGVLVAVWGSRLIVAQLSTTQNRVFLPVGVDWRMLAFTAAAAAGTALLFGTVPALRAARVDPSEAMKEQGRATSSGRRVGLAGSLVVAQVALSLVLLIAAGLFVRTFASLASVDVGFERDRALLVHIGTRRAGVDDSVARAAMYARILETARAVPGVSHAALSELTPVGGPMANFPMEFPWIPEHDKRERAVMMNVVSPGWFAALGTPVIAGRDFTSDDRLGSPRAMIVNRAFVAKYFGTENPIGRQIRELPTPHGDPAPLEIVGVVGDAIYSSLRRGSPPTMYWALAQQNQQPGGQSLVVRAAAGTPMSLARSVETAVMSVNRDLTLVVRPLADQVNGSLVRERLVATLSGFFGALALLLAALGLYGVTSYAVTRRHIELGIRMALGSTPSGVVRLVLGRVALLVGGGVVLGAAIGWWASRFVETLLFGLAPRDPVTIAGAIVLLAAVGAFAGWLPAARASRIDPARVLREG
ncbi:MAG: ABC transporter permease [Gemmatimonadaceae bacterium]